MMIRRGDRKYREFECSECEIKRHIYEIERENLYYFFFWRKCGREHSILILAKQRLGMHYHRVLHQFQKHPSRHEIIFHAF